MENKKNSWVLTINSKEAHFLVRIREAANFWAFVVEEQKAPQRNMQLNFSTNVRNPQAAKNKRAETKVCVLFVDGATFRSQVECN
jgi:hypothetical protein